MRRRRYHQLAVAQLPAWLTFTAPEITAGERAEPPSSISPPSAFAEIVSEPRCKCYGISYAYFTL